MLKHENTTADGFGNGAPVIDPPGSDHHADSPANACSQAQRAPVLASELPRPLVPPDLDTSGKPAMLIHVERIRNSRLWLRANRRPEIAFYALNLMFRAFRELPAGSIANDDDVLLDASRCPPGAWSVLRDDILSGWCLCSDGRLYHPEVADAALGILARDINYAFQKAHGAYRQSKTRAKREGKSEPQRPNYADWLSRNYASAVPYLDDLCRHWPKSMRDDLGLSQGHQPRVAVTPPEVTAANILGHSKIGTEYESESEREFENERSDSDHKPSYDTPLLGSLTGPDKVVSCSKPRDGDGTSPREIAQKVLMADEAMEATYGR
jgi:hypothetical protein